MSAKHCSSIAMYLKECLFVLVHFLVVQERITWPLQCELQWQKSIQIYHAPCQHIYSQSFCKRDSCSQYFPVELPFHWLVLCRPTIVARGPIESFDQCLSCVQVGPHPNEQESSGCCTHPSKIINIKQKNRYEIE